jgi:hypothetical protein
MRYTRLHGFRDRSLGPAMWKMTRRSGKAGDRLADGLSDAELQVFHAFPTGSLVKLGSGDAEDDPPHQEGWGPGQLVRAAFLVSLLCGAVEVEPGLVGAVNIEGACVIGELGFPQVTFKHRLRLHDCYVPDGINLEEATTRTLLLDGCDVAAIYLLGAKIDGSLVLSGAHVGGRDRHAIAADRLAITGNVWCDKGFQASGGIGLAGASIGGQQLIFSGAHLDGKGEPVLYAQGLTVTRGMFLDEGFRADGAVNLMGAKIGSLVDEVGSWPQALNLDGLTYDDLTNMPARKRLDWLDRSVDYAPQPYEQLAAHYRRLGHDEEARRVLLAKLRQRRRQRPWWARWWGWLQDLLAGYGYAPGRAVLLLAGAFVAGWLVFSTRHPVPVARARARNSTPRCTPSMC